MDVNAYGRQLTALLPPGAAWLAERDGVLANLLLGVSEEFARIEARGADAVDESDPRTALELLADWEQVLGLPDDCLTEIPDAVSERQAAITARFVAHGGQSPQYYIDIASALGFEISITEYRPFRAGRGRCGDPCSDVDWAHTWRVNMPDEVDRHFRVFRAGVGRAGDRLVGWSVLDIECILARLAPAHTILLIYYPAA